MNLIEPDIAQLVNELMDTFIDDGSCEFTTALAEPLPSWGGLLRELEDGAAMSHLWLLAPVLLLAAVVGSFQLILPREDYSL